MRTIFSSLVAAAVAAFVALAGILAAEFAAMPLSYATALSSAPTLYGAALVYAVALGVPAAWATRRRANSRTARFALVGLAAGLLPGCLIAYAAGVFATESGSWLGAAFFVVVGAAVGLAAGGAFGATMQLMSPNNSSKPTPLRGAA